MPKRNSRNEAVLRAGGPVTKDVGGIRRGASDPGLTACGKDLRHPHVRQPGPPHVPRVAEWVQLVKKQKVCVFVLLEILECNPSKQTGR